MSRILKKIAGKTIEQWQKDLPLLKTMMDGKPVFWCNPQYQAESTKDTVYERFREDVADADARLKRFAPYIAQVYPETRAAQGIIESPLQKIPVMQQHLSKAAGIPLPGMLMAKCDNLLAISGSIKARGGIYEVLKTAETMAMNQGLLKLEDDYTCLDSDDFKQFFSQYAVAVGSTGNLGLSIGIMGAQMGFKVYVHMSADAALWKKQRLKACGVKVIEYESDYSSAVAAGRMQAQTDPKMHFIDDENSKDLLLGYAVAAQRLKKQLAFQGVCVDKDHPLFVYLPCGVGGGPGGITLGLKLVFGDCVHCFFAEPTQSPCMLLGLMTGLHDKISVRDIGLSNCTDADGLAVGRPSGFVGNTLGAVISGSYTVADATLYQLLQALADRESIFLEPSAAAGLAGPTSLLRSTENASDPVQLGLTPRRENATHLVWATGGGMVPESVMQAYYRHSH